MIDTKPDMESLTQCMERVEVLAEQVHIEAKRQSLERGVRMTTLTTMLAEVGIDHSALTILYEGNGNNIYRLTVPRLDTFAIWRNLYGLRERTGYLPVIIGDVLQLEWFHNMLELYARSDEPHFNAIGSIVERGLALDVNAWIARESRGQEWQHGAWSEEKEPNHDDEWKIPKYYRDDLNIALAPTLYPWQLPAYLKFGNFNACPSADVHVALFKRWDELVGLQVIHMSHDSIDARMLRPPADPALALQLTQEHFVYCGETACYGNTVESYASGLMQGQQWHFWWD